jgi:hypothetical protein
MVEPGARVAKAETEVREVSHYISASGQERVVMEDGVKPVGRAVAVAEVQVAPAMASSALAMRFPTARV